MITYIKKNKWIIILISFIVINIGCMIYNHEMNKDTIQLEENRHTIEQQVDGENKENKEDKEYEESKEDKGFKEGNIVNVEEKEAVQLVEAVDQDEPSADNKGVATVEIEVEEVPIYICGEVKRPGVYYVPIYAIVNDVMEKCGGFTADANQVAINLASPITPNEKIIVPKMGEEIDKLADSYENRERIGLSSVSPEATVNQSTLISINTATKEELMTLNGIGEVKAVAIINYRQEKGLFNSIDEIKNISGIGEKTFEKIKQFITT